MKKVIHFKASPYLPVTETWIYEQIKNLKRYKPVVYALLTENLNLYPTDIIRSLELGKSPRNFSSFFNEGWNRLFNFYPGFIFSLIKDKPNLVHAHFGPSGHNFLFYKSLFNLPMITTFYGYDIGLLPNQNSAWKKRYIQLFRKGNCFLVEGNNMERSLIELGCPEEKIIVQHIGIDLEKIKFIPRSADTDGPVKILIASSLKEKKGIPYAIAAFGEIKKSHPGLNLELTIIGDSDGQSDGEKEKGKILNLINKYNIESHVKLLGFVSHKTLIEEANKHHIFISPSVSSPDGDNEGGAPVAIIEMSASGMPILSTRHCDIPEVVIDGKSGFLVNERDIAGLAEKLELLILNPEKWRTFGEYGRKHIEAEYDIKKQINKLEKIYDKLLTG